MERKKIIWIVIIGLIIGLILFARFTIRKSYAYSANDFPDNNFYRCVIDAYNKKNNSSISYSEELTKSQLETITDLNCKYISDTKGIEYLTSLIELNISYVKKMNLGNNTKLQRLYLHDDMLENLDLNNNTKLTILSIYDGNLTALDLSGQTDLKDLYVTNSALEEIDISNSSNIASLKINNSMLKTIKFPKENNYSNFSLEGNYLNNIELPELTKLTNPLTHLGVQYVNQFSISYDENKEIVPTGEYKFYLNNKIVIPQKEEVGSFISNLRLNNLSAKVYRNDNEVVAGNVISGDILSVYDEDKEVQSLVIKVFANDLFEDENLYGCIINQYNMVNKTELTTEDRLTKSQLESLTSLICYGHKDDSDKKIYSTAGLENLINLKELRLTEQLLSNINLRNHLKLEKLYLAGNKITDIDLSENVQLKFLDLGFWTITDYIYDGGIISAIGSGRGNRLTSLDVSKLSNLKELYINNNRIEQLDVTQNEKITEINAGDNRLSSVDLSNNSLLETVDFEYNQLKTINIQNNLNIENLDVANNQITELNVGHLKKLQSLYASNNLISSINIKNNEQLIKLVMSNNELNEIDVTKNPKLLVLEIDSNNIEKIDITNNPELNTIRLMVLPINRIDISKNYKLTEIRVDQTNISNLSILHLPNLKKLGISKTPIKSINLSNNYQLTNIYMDKKQMVEYNINSDVGKYALKFKNLNSGIFSTGDLMQYADYEYIVVVRGDLTGNGQLKINDVSKAYQALKGNIELNDLEKIAVDVTKEGKFKINDIAKMYQNIKEK